jgi:His/Glu/Gln/Arg/opine family amino acid ABC transporter permease subunit
MSAEKPGLLRKILHGALVALLIVLFFGYAAIRLGHNWQWARLWPYRSKFAFGFGVTLLLSVTSLAGSLLLGILTAFARQSKILAVRYLARVYIEIIRGTPLLVQTIFFFYFIGTAYRLENRYWMGILILSVFAGAYVAEIIRRRTGVDPVRPAGNGPVPVFHTGTDPALHRRSPAGAHRPAATDRPVCIADQRLLHPVLYRRQ